MTDTAGPDARLKSASDLWIHQNSLMWSRLQTLAILQAGFLGIAFTLGQKKYPMLGAIACVFLITLTVALWLISRADQKARNVYADRIKALDFEMHTQSIPAFGAAGYLATAFWSLVIVDVAAAIVILIGTPS